MSLLYTCKIPYEYDNMYYANIYCLWRKWFKYRPGMTGGCEPTIFPRERNHFPSRRAVNICFIYRLKIFLTSSSLSFIKNWNPNFRCMNCTDLFVNNCLQVAIDKNGDRKHAIAWVWWCQRAIVHFDGRFLPARELSGKLSEYSHRNFKNQPMKNKQEYFQSVFNIL